MAGGVRKRRGVCARRPSASLGLAPQRSRNPRHAAPVDILDGRKTTFLRFIPASRPARRIGALVARNRNRVPLTHPSSPLKVFEKKIRAVRGKPTTATIARSNHKSRSWLSLASERMSK